MNQGEHVSHSQYLKRYPLVPPKGLINAVKESSCKVHTHTDRQLQYIYHDTPTRQKAGMCEHENGVTMSGRAGCILYTLYSTIVRKAYLCGYGLYPPELAVSPTVLKRRSHCQRGSQAGCGTTLDLGYIRSRPPGRYIQLSLGRARSLAGGELRPARRSDRDGAHEHDLGSSRSTAWGHGACSY